MQAEVYVIKTSETVISEVSGIIKECYPDSVNITYCGAYGWKQNTWQFRVELDTGKRILQIVETINSAELNQVSK